MCARDFLQLLPINFIVGVIAYGRSAPDSTGTLNRTEVTRGVNVNPVNLSKGKPSPRYSGPVPSALGKVKPDFALVNQQSV